MVSGQACTSPSVPTGSRPGTSCDVFPPVHHVFERDGSLDTLRSWTDALQRQIVEVSRSQVELPVEEVWHWFAANERLSRSLAFVDHPDVVEEVGMVSVANGETQEVLDWRDVVRQLRVLQKEACWNARYLQVVEEPLASLTADTNTEALPRTLKTLLRSLHRIYTAGHFKESRMTLLLQSVLKVLVAQAATNLCSPYRVCSPDVDARGVLKAAEQMRDAFQMYVDHYFILPLSGPGKFPQARRPATAMGTRSDHFVLSTARKNVNHGWWQTIGRTCVQQAEHCAFFCGGLAALFSKSMLLTEMMPDIQLHTPAIFREAEECIHMYSGVKDGGEIFTLLEAGRVEAGLQLREVEQRLESVISRVDLAHRGGTLGDLPSGFSATAGAEVLVIEDPGHQRAQSAMLTSKELERSIETMRGELDAFGSDLDSLCDTIAADKPCSFPKSDWRRAEEVARMSSWYCEPHQIFDENVELIEVNQNITVKEVSYPSRPRTSQPRLFTAPPTSSRETEGTPSVSCERVVASVSAGNQVSIELLSSHDSDGVSEDEAAPMDKAVTWRVI